ncbi:MAG: radical SAM/SPASM domain-containing protein [Armatimonadota bacterium]
MSKQINLIPRVIGYKLSKAGLIKTPAPINLTLSVTNMCQSRCKTCGIWRLYQQNPERFKDELTLDEIEKIFATVGNVHFFNISGGEPFLRKDLPKIVEAACNHLNPAVIHTPTNAIMPRIIEERVTEILEIIKSTGKDIAFTIKPSFDGVGDVHDQIRGVQGNFDKVLDTVNRLRNLKERYPNLEIGLGTIISKFNLDTIKDTARYAREVGVDSYISEIAEERTELFNVGDGITPDASEYERAIKTFNKELENGNFSGDKVSGTTLAFRQVYYSYAIQIMKEQRQVLPCYAGIANAHINPYGDVWPCCILGYDKTMGNLRDYDYDFKKIWNSKQASDVRQYIADKNCACPLANQAYSNILCSPAAMMKVFQQMHSGETERVNA